ncbi:MAG: cytochrome P450 [Deltaproteobacteria bacterium]|nr:cytochrome P450 [Deltaproteobacteria bacterium]
MANADVSTATSGDFDLFLPLRSRGGLENPFAIYALLRTVRPVMRMPVGGWDGPGVWFLTRHSDVETVLRDPRFSVDRLRAPFIRENLERLPAFIQQGAQTLRSMLVMDPPDHTRVRKLVNKAFTPRRIAALRERVVAIVDELLAPVRDQMDVIDALAAPLPAIVIAELLGVPPEDHRRFKAWAAEIVASIGQPSFGGSAGGTGAPAIQQLFGYLGEIIAARRAAPRDDLISAMVQAQEADDALSDAELLATSNLLLIAGHETTTNLIGNGLLALLREPDQLARLRGDLGLLPTAIEELLRYDGPVQATLRVAREDVELGGQAIEAGSLLLVGIGAANHDPDVFADPERLDLGRDPNPHLGFGFGAHFCLGAPLARLEGEVAFRALLERFPRLELATESPTYRPNPVLRGLTALPVRC